MKISLNWLNEFLPSRLENTGDLSKKLTALGIEVEGIETRGGSFTNVVVGKVLSREKHPNADKLSLCKVNVGHAVPLSIVCGAANVAAGQTVAVALVGAKLPIKGKSGDPTVLEIKKSKIRGEVSEGMICAEDELGLSENHDGIMILPETYIVGEPFEKYVRRDTVFEISITPNRADVLSHLGVARELTGDTNLIKPTAPKLEFKPNTPRVTVEDTANCPYYAAVIIEGVTIAPSPIWLQETLQALGLRPINNVVDITNYVLHGLGQPLHAFDLDKLSGKRIVVKSTVGEEFQTLDNKTRILTAGDVMICDAEKPVAIGGVMGGLHSEISQTTKNVLLESAYFNPTAIRRTAKRLSLSTDASYRFERGTDYALPRYAAELAAKLITELAGGKITEAAEHKGELPKPLELTLRPARASAFLGANIPTERQVEILSHLGFKELRRDSTTITFLAPTHRVDMAEEIDLIEEIARVYGYDNLAPSEKMNAAYPQSRNALANFEDDVRLMAIGFGFKEILTNPLLPLAEASLFSENLVRTLNPVSEDMDALRPAMTPSLLKIISSNIRKGNKDLRLFEIGHTFEKDAEGGTYLKGYRERSVLGIALTGERLPVSWANAKAAVDFFDLKGAVEQVLQKLHLIDKSKFIPYTPSELRLVISADVRGKNASDLMAGRLQIVPKQLTTRFDIEQSVFIAELDMAVLKEAAGAALAMVYQEPAKFPVAFRDLAFLVTKSVMANDMISVLNQSDARIQSVRLFDVYESQTGKSETTVESRRSLAFTLKVANHERTMTDEEISAVVANAVEQVRSKFGAELRQN
jgi:phenylalanyl-tRNA synthetase beta chain